MVTVSMVAPRPFIVALVAVAKLTARHASLVTLTVVLLTVRFTTVAPLEVFLVVFLLCLLLR